MEDPSQGTNGQQSRIAGRAGRGKEVKMNGDGRVRRDAQRHQTRGAEGGHGGDGEGGRGGSGADGAEDGGLSLAEGI